MGKIRTAKPYTPGRGECQLCNNEKVQTNAHVGKTYLNKIMEIGQACRHKARFKVANIATYPYQGSDEWQWPLKNYTVSFQPQP